MTASPFAFPRFRAFDSNGVPLSGGLLYTYLAGTTTPLSTYTDSSGNVANTNPVVLDATGQADIWLGTSANYKFVLKDANGVTYWTVDNYPPSSSGSSGGGVSASTVTPGGRLTLTSGVPVTTGNVTGATTVYYVPYKSDMVPLFDGTAWALYSIGTGISQATTDNTKSPAAVANNSNYDCFVWNDAGTVRLSRGPIWTSDTARGSGVGTTELVFQNGKFVNKNDITNGPKALTGLYVGSVRSDGSAQLNDSYGLTAAPMRLVWNAYNRVSRAMLRLESTTSWTYNTVSWHQANASSANQLNVLVGLSEDVVTARAAHCASNGGHLIASFATAIGLDSTSAPDSLCIYAPAASNESAAAVEYTACPVASWNGYPGLGYHYLSWLECPLDSTANNFWFGTSSTGAGFHSGITGEVLA